MIVIAESEGKRNRRWKVEVMINLLLINSKCDDGVLFFLYHVPLNTQKVAKKLTFFI